MSGFLVALRKDNRPASAVYYDDMRRSLRTFGGDCDNMFDHGRFTLIWVHDTGYTPQDSLEFQPVAADGRWLLVFMGFLMHREELALALNVPLAVAARTSDSALVMLAWQAWGENCLDHLSGPFSFVVCDTQRQTMFAARGQERGGTIYYHDNAERLILATSTKPLFCDPAVPREVDEVRIADALVLNYEDTERSYFKTIRVVPGGHVMHADPDRMELRRYYHLGNVKDVRFGRDEDYVEAANELLGKAVASSMRAYQTPAISLSSGLDSPAVAIAMIEQIGAGSVPHTAPVKAFTSVPAPFWDGRSRKGWHGDESGPVKALAAAYPDLDVEFVPSEHLQFDHGLDLIQSYVDIPIRGVGNLHWGLDLAQRCRQIGARVKLTGSSGNATLSMAIADTIFARWLREGRWITLLREHHLAMRRTGGDGGYIRKLLGRSLLPNMPDWLYDRYLGSGRGTAMTGFEVFSGINPAYARAMDVSGRMAQFGWNDRYRKPRTRRELMRIMTERGARDQAGAMGEGFKVMTGVQARDPLGDRRLIEFCYAIPDDQFFKHGVDRRLIKRMMAGKLPPEIRQAPRGEQAADWHGRMARDLARIDEELARLAENPAMAARLDIPRMRKCIAEWPAATPVAPSDSPDFAFMRYAIGRALAVARFINHVEGRN